MEEDSSGGGAIVKNADMMRHRTASGSSAAAAAQDQELSADEANNNNDAHNKRSSSPHSMDMTTPTTTRNMSLLFSPRGKSVASMSFALAIHLGGYECSRAAVMALFTSDGLGFGKSKKDKSQESELSALPMAVGCVSPFAVALVWFYGKTLSHGGPSYVLRTHTLIVAA